MRTRRSPTLSTMRVPDKVPTVIEAFEDRLYTLISHANDRLGEVEYLAGDISVADLSFYPMSRCANRCSRLERCCRIWSAGRP